MHEIAKSNFPTPEHEDSFQRLINAHIEELRAHRHRIKMVEKTKNLKDDDPNKWHMCPAPSAHPDIEKAIVEDGDDFNIEYKIISDEPEKTLEEKKNDLVSEATREAAKLQEKILPIRKRPLLEMKVNDIHQKIHRKMSSTEGLSFDDALKEMDKEARNNVRLHTYASDKSHKVAYHLAKLQDEIHDLTEDDIDNWKPEAFPEV